MVSLKQLAGNRRHEEVYTQVSKSSMCLEITKFLSGDSNISSFWRVLVCSFLIWNISHCQTSSLSMKKQHPLANWDGVYESHCLG